MEFLSAIVGGLVGAIAGVLGAFAFEVRRERNARRAAARAVVLELVQNSAAIRTVNMGSLSIALSTSTWQEARLTLAGTISPEEFATVGAVESTIAGFLDQMTPDRSASQLFGPMNESLPDIEAAAELLERVGWSESERAAFKKTKDAIYSRAEQR